MHSLFRRPVHLLLGLGALMTVLMLPVPRLQAALLRNVPQVLLQPDGTVVHLLATGDEYYNRLHDADDFTVVRDPDSGYLVYATKVDGRLRPTALVVGRSDPKAAGLAMGIMPDPKTMPSPRQLFPQGMMAHTMGMPGVPSFSAINNLVVFIRFADEPEFNAPISAYDAKFNSTATGAASMRNYFTEASYGKVTISSTFYPTPSGGYVVSYVDSHPRSYYRPYDATTNPDGYDPNSMEQYEREWALLVNATNAIASQVPSSLNVDTNGDGKVDSVTFVVSGMPEGWGDLLWPHQWVLRYYPVTATINGKTVDDYNFELNDYLFVAVLCHEMTHTLGAPDLYRYSDQSAFPVGPWDLMDANLDPPQHMSAYMKYRYLGWIPSIPEITNPATVTLNPLTSPTNNCFRIASPRSSSEYFVVEYRRRAGTFENSLPGSGLLVYRINTAIDGFGNRYGPPDEVYVYRPGGTTTARGDVTEANLGADVLRPSINDSTDPSSFLSDGSTGGLVISSIGSAGSTISFDSGIGGGPGVETVFSDGFEGPFPGSWKLSPANPDVGWGRSEYVSSNSFHSAGCAAGGVSPQPPGGQYVPNMNTWMIYGPFSLADATAASAEFDLWLDTEPYNQDTQKGDRFSWLISTGGDWHGFSWSAQTKGWVHVPFYLKNVAGINAMGAHEVWFAFVFESDADVQGRGAFVDNLVIRKLTAQRAAPACSVLIGRVSGLFPRAGGTGSLVVKMASTSNCSWTATSGVPWLTITSGETGTGSGSVSYSVQGNPGDARSGGIVIAGQTFTVRQDGEPCSLVFSPPSASISASGGSASFTLSTVSGCPWIAVSGAAWLHITSGGSGIGDGAVTYAVDANTGPARSGAIAVGNQTFTVEQGDGRQALAYRYWVPAVIHKDVPWRNAWWRSDVAVLNLSPQVASITLKVYAPSGLRTKATTVGPNEQVVLADIVGQLGLTAGSGALEVASDQGVFVTARTYSQVDATHTYGQGYAAQQSSALLGVGQSAWLLQLVQNALFRTNIGITNTGSTTANVTVTLYDAQGNPVGWSGTRDYAPGEFYQHDQPFAKTDARGVDAGYARVTVNSGSGVLAYASVIDQATGDPTTITMKRGAPIGSAPFSHWLPAVIHKDVPWRNAWWRSDVAVLNRSAEAASVTLNVWAPSGLQTKMITLGPNEQMVLADLAGQVGITADSAALEVVSDQDVFLTGRTYNQVDSTHTYGQDCDVQESLQLLGAGQSAWLPQLAQNALFRTNIGITNTGSTTANVTVTLYDASGNEVWSHTRDYGAGGFYQLDQPYANAAAGGVDSGYAKVTVNSGSGVVAYASVIDQATGDPTTINTMR